MLLMVLGTLGALTVRPRLMCPAASWLGIMHPRDLCEQRGGGGVTVKIGAFPCELGRSQGLPSLP
jgi:hypothetical protein